MASATEAQAIEIKNCPVKLRTATRKSREQPSNTGLFSRPGPLNRKSTIASIIGFLFGKPEDILTILLTCFHTGWFIISDE